MRVLDGTPIETVSTAIEPPLSEAAAAAWIPRTCFKNGPPSQVGIELEFLVVDAREPADSSALYPADRYPELLQALAAGGLDGKLTVEPGGQVELSSRPGPDLPQALAVVERDLAALRRRAARLDARLVGIGVDPFRIGQRIIDEPRYAAMEHYFAPWGSAGRTMMRSTASVQVNVEAGLSRAASPPPVQPLTDATQRWELLHAIGPTLVATFANSAHQEGRPTGWQSTRQAAWQALDPRRTGAPAVRRGESVPDAYARWALDAPLMVVRRDRGPWTPPRNLTFRDWVRAGRDAIPDVPAPTSSDLDYHLSTLFPQVRARGHLEVRYLDAQPDDWWTVPPAVITALLDDAVAADQARDVCSPVEDQWLEAARSGLADPALAAAAHRILPIAVAALRRQPGSESIAGQVEAYFDRWTARGRCPADDPPANTAPQPTHASNDRHQGDDQR